MGSDKFSEQRKVFKFYKEPSNAVVAKGGMHVGQPYTAIPSGYLWWVLREFTRDDIRFIAVQELLDRNVASMESVLTEYANSEGNRERQVQSYLQPFADDKGRYQRGEDRFLIPLPWVQYLTKREKGFTWTMRDDRGGTPGFEPYDGVEDQTEDPWFAASGGQLLWRQSVVDVLRKRMPLDFSLLEASVGLDETMKQLSIEARTLGKVVGEGRFEYQGLVWEVKSGKREVGNAVANQVRIESVS